MKEKAYLIFEIPFWIKVKCPKCGYVSIFTKKELIEHMKSILHLTVGCKSSSRCNQKVLDLKKNGDGGVIELHIIAYSITIDLKRRSRRRRSKSKVAGKQKTA